MEIEILADAPAVAKRGVELIASSARRAVSAREIFNVAFSGGRTPWLMLSMLSLEALPWHRVQVMQVDERIAPHDSPDRNIGRLRESLGGAPLAAEQIHAMPVEMSDLAAAAANYMAILAAVAGTPAVLDLVHLGLGADGHTASLVPDDEVLRVADKDIALSGSYQGRRRMTMTYPLINRARRVLWIVSGEEKAPALRRLLAGDRGIPAGRIRQDNAYLLADQAAAGKVDEGA